MGIIVPNLKKQYKIKFACSWADSKSITDRVMLNWGKPPENITLVNNDDFDYLISFNDSKERLNVAPEKDVVFTMEPSWSPNLLEEYTIKSLDNTLTSPSTNASFYKFFDSVKAGQYDKNSISRIIRYLLGIIRKQLAVDTTYTTITTNTNII